MDNVLVNWTRTRTRSEERRAYRVDLGTDELEHDSPARAGHVPERDAPRRCLPLTPAAADIGARW